MGERRAESPRATTRPGAFHIEHWRGNRQAQFVAELGCDEDRGCEESNAAKTWVRGLRLTLADYADPEVAAGGLCG